MVEGTECSPQASDDLMFSVSCGRKASCPYFPSSRHISPVIFTLPSICCHRIGDPGGSHPAGGKWLTVTSAPRRLITSARFNPKLMIFHALSIIAIVSRATAGGSADPLQQEGRELHRGEGTEVRVEEAAVHFVFKFGLLGTDEWKEDEPEARSRIGFRISELSKVIVPLCLNLPRKLPKNR